MPRELSGGCTRDGGFPCAERSPVRLLLGGPLGVCLEHCFCGLSVWSCDHLGQALGILPLVP